MQEQAHDPVTEAKGQIGFITMFCQPLLDATVVIVPGEWRRAVKEYYICRFFVYSTRAGNLTIHLSNPFDIRCRFLLLRSDANMPFFQ